MQRDSCAANMRHNVQFKSINEAVNGDKDYCSNGAGVSLLGAMRLNLINTCLLRRTR